MAKKKTIQVLATEVVEMLDAAGFEAFWVGGCVRDTLLQRTGMFFRSDGDG